MLPAAAAGSAGSGGQWGQSGQGCVTFNLPSRTGEVSLTTRTQTDNMKQLLDEVKGLHEQRLRWLELDDTMTREELLQKKEDFLQSYVNDLTDHNQLLVQTIEELQMEADHDLFSSEKKLHTSVHSLDALDQQQTSRELGHHLRHLRSDGNSITQLIQQTGHMHNLDAEAKMAALRSELGALMERRMEEREASVNQLTEELMGVKHEMGERRERVRHLNEDVAGLRASQESLRRSLARKEKHAEQLVRDNTQLRETLTSLHCKLETKERMLQDVSQTLEQTRVGLDAERQQREQVQDQLRHGNKEAERLRQELTQLCHATEKKMQRRETRICLLMKELAQSKKQHSDCQQELLRRERDLETAHQERDELRARMEERSKECVHLIQTKESLEADLARSQEKLRGSHLEIRSRDELILQLRGEMKTAEEKHQSAGEQVASLEREVRHLNQRVRGQQEEACQLGRKVREAEHTKDQKEEEQRQLRDQLLTSQQQAEASEGALKRQGEELGRLHQQLKDARMQNKEQKETAAIFKQKYVAAMEKVHKVQGQVEHLEEELRYSQQQLRESQSEAESLTRERDELERRHQEKVGQWESSQEALDQLTEELQASQDLLRQSQQQVEHFRTMTASLQEQGDTLRQQKLMLECDLRRHQQSHSHSDEEYLSLHRHRQQLQKRCTEQGERVAECEKALLQMKSELERQGQETAGLKQRLALSHHTHLSSRSQLEQEVTRLTSDVTRLEQELADAQKVHVSLVRRSEAELAEARREAAGASRAARRLQEELQQEEERMRRVDIEKQSLSAHSRRLSQELDELRGKHQATVEDLAARAEEVRRMEGRLDEGKLAEEKIRSAAVELEAEVAELRKSLQLAVNHGVKAEREKADAQQQVDALQSELERTRADNANLHHESKMVMTNVNCWITEQTASSEDLSARMKVQSKMLLTVTEEKERLQEANDTLKVEVKRLREVADERERDAERIKAQIRDRSFRQDERTGENRTCVARNLGEIQQMQTRLRRNLEAIGVLNQQLNALSGENKQLRRLLAEERSMRRQVEKLLPPPPPTSHHSSCVSLPARPPPLNASLPSSRRLPTPLGLDLATGHADGIPAQAKLRVAGPESPGESQGLCEALRMRPAAGGALSASLGDAWSGRTRRDRTKTKPPEDFDLS